MVVRDATITHICPTCRRRLLATRGKLVCTNGQCTSEATMKLIKDLTHDEAADEMRLREELRDLADIATSDPVADVSRRPDTGDLRVRLDDGAIVTVDHTIVDAYLESRRAA